MTILRRTWRYIWQLLLASSLRASAYAGCPGSEAQIVAQRAEISLLKTALNHVGRGISMIDGNGRIVLANDQAITTLGVSKEFLAAKPLFSEVVAMQWQSTEFKNASEELKARFRHLKMLNRSECYRRQRPNGRWIEIESVPLPDGGTVRTHTDITDRYEAERKIERLARSDFLTGLANRSCFQDALDAALQAREGTALLLIDVDRFKHVNDTYGHLSGDLLLQEWASRLTRCVRTGDFVARLGGDEFAVVLTPILNPAEAEQMAARIMEQAKQPCQLADRLIDVGISIGIAVVPPGQEADGLMIGRSDLMQQADLALYEAKEAGRSTWRLFDPVLQQRYLTDQALLNEVRTAFAEEQFEVYYQPVIDMRSGQVSAFEALLRWHHPTRGLLDAGEFIPTAEASGLIVPLGAWVLRRSCCDAAGWPASVRLLVNISPKQLGTGGLLEAVRDALGAASLPAARLELEVTETALLQASETISSCLGGLRQLGVKLALDDFGTGYSSLSHIRLFRFDTVKIDRSFVNDAVGRRDCAAIVRAIATLAHELGMTTIAEGVETKDQLAWLHTIGCDEAQGYLFERPRPSHDVPEMLGKVSRWLELTEVRRRVHKPRRTTRSRKFSHMRPIQYGVPIRL